MNKVYRSVWNESTKTWVAVQENASGRSKSASGSAGLGIDAVVGALTRTNLGRSAMALAVMGAISPSVFAAGEAGGTIEMCHAGGTDGTGIVANMGLGGIGDCYGGGGGLWINGSYENRVYSGAAVGNQTYMSFNATSGTVLVGAGNGIFLENQTSLTGNKIVSLAKGAVNSGSAEAINGSQLYGLGSSVATAFGSGSSMTSAGSFVAPTYKLGGKSYSNAGDAFTALYGSITNASGSIDAVLYDSTAHNSVTLGGVGKSHVPVALTNVAAGAVHASSIDAINGSQLYGLAASTAGALGGATTVNANGSISAPSYVLKSGTYNNVGAALGALDVGGSGNDPLAVHYDNSSMATVKFGGLGSTTPVTLSNVAPGVQDTDAVNVKQMHDAAVTGNPYIGGIGGSWNSPNAAKATALNSVALGLNSVADEGLTISVGNSSTGLMRRITNVMDGQADSDAATVGQVSQAMGATAATTQAALKQTSNQMLAAIQNVDDQVQAVSQQVQAVRSLGSMVGATSGSAYFQADGMGDGSDNAYVATNSYGVAVGAMSTATGANSTALGSQTLATGTATTAIGVNSTATGQGALAIGSAKATGKNAIALGNGEVASGDNTFAAGFNAKATGLNSLAFGNTAAASATDSMAFGTIAQVSSTATNSIALGRATSVLSGATDSVALGSSSVADRMNSISVGSANRQRQIIYVAKGTAGTDAVNVSQLTDAVSAFGSGASVGANGSVVKPAYAIDGNTYNNVGDALAALNASAVQYDDTSFSKVTLGGSGHAPVTMTNVANGALNATSLDAVNGQQLNATNTNVSKLAGDVTDIYGKLADAVIYDTSSHDSVTLGGSGHAAVTLTNVANGGLTASSVDAVNGSQLYALGAKTDPSGNITNAFVAYDNTSMGKVTLGGDADHAPVVLTNVANGGLTASSVDAVNGSQLYALGAKTDPSGNITNAFVAYDDTSMGKVTLGGDADHAPVVLTNVANGGMSASSVDAVNGAQLYALGAKTDPSGNIYALGAKTDPSGNITNAFVAYDDTSMGKVTLGGDADHAPVVLTNVANGGLNASSLDAVNGSQLYALGAKADASGNIANKFVAYDDTSMSTVTFGESLTHAPVLLTNVAAGKVSASSVDAVNGTQLYGLASQTAGALGAGSTVDANGALVNPTYTVAGGTYHNVGDALDALAGVGPGTDPLAVHYDSGSWNSVTLGGSGHTPVVLTNVANGGLTVSSVDAVNGSQLYALGAKTDESGNITNAFVAYDDTSMSKVTLGGGADHAPVVLTNVANGGLTVSSLDAVNGSQLYALGAKTDASGNIINAFVAYDDTSMNSVTFGGSGHAPVVLHNVANGVDSNDAVNVAQLEAMGAKIDGSGNVMNGFVAYDDSTMSTVTLGGGKDKPAVLITNVKAGQVSASSSDAVNGAQLYAAGSSTASALGGGSTVNADGSISAPTYALAEGTFNNVGSAISNIDGRVTNIAKTVTNIEGQVANAVQYDSSAHDKITLGGSGSTTAVALTNVANGALNADSLDAVNGSQLYATNVEVANLNQQIQNINVNGSEYLSTNTTSGAASATGTNSIAAGGGAIASGASSTAIGDSAKATGNNSVALGANSVADEDNTVSVGSEGNERRITNVANGVNPTDAANMGQLQSGLNALQSNVNSVARTAYSGVAAATALTMIPDVDQGKTIAVGVGTANFQGYQAVALGASARITQNLKVKLGGGYGSSGGATFGGGMSYQW